MEIPSNLEIKEYSSEKKEKIKKFVKATIEGILGRRTKGLDDLDYIESNFEVFYYIEHEGKIIATAGIKNDGDARISRLYVRDSERNKGIGTLLMNRLVEHCTGKFKRMHLTETEKSGVEKFFEKFGFKTYRKTEDGKIWMEKILDESYSLSEE
jgi:N-acetylglutamate synthase-like GNAT family acetyltransferase